MSANPYMTLDTYIQRTELFFNMSQISSGNVIYAGTPKTSPEGMVQCINSLTRYNALQEKIIDYGQMNKISSYSATCKATRHIDNPPPWYDDLPFNYDGYHPSDDDINDTFTFTCTSSDHIL